MSTNICTDSHGWEVGAVLKAISEASQARGAQPHFIRRPQHVCWLPTAWSPHIIHSSLVSPFVSLEYKKGEF
ncbi:unnamed protein product, partial [Brenthis ino]